LENGLTPEGYAWSQVPYTSANPGATRYSGWSQVGDDSIEPHVVGADGYAYLRLYEMTGNTKYLRAAIRCADAPGQELQARRREATLPGPFAVGRADGKIGGGGTGPYSANVVEPIMLFDELVSLWIKAMSASLYPSAGRCLGLVFRNIR